MTAVDRLESIRTFIAVADEQGFAAAARRLGLSAPAVTRAIAALEEHVGAPLLHRTTRTVRLTAVGTRYLGDVKRILAELERADAAVASAHDQLRGEVSVTAPHLFGRMHVAPLLFEFMAAHPEIGARTLFVDAVVDLHEEDVDVAVRIGPLQDSSLTAVKVGEVRRVLCASPEYLARRGVPRSPDELATHELVMFMGLGAPRSWTFASAGRSFELRPTPRLVVNTGEVAIAAAVAGHGIARVLSYQVGPEVRGGALVRVLEEFEGPALPVHVVQRHGRKGPARLRAFVGFLAPRLRTLLRSAQRQGSPPGQ
jgi:DNA-binding transcriptional LysR family regulator